MKIRPLHDQVLIRRIASEDRTRGGLYIPSVAQEKTNEGVVIRVGDGKVLPNGQRQTLSVKEGDRVLFGKFAPTELRVEGETLLMVKEAEIFALIE